MPSANSRFLPKRLADAYFTGSFRFMLVSAVPSESNLDTWDFRNDITNEVTGTGYTAGGVPVTVTVGAVDAANSRVAVTIGNLSPGWTSATITAVGGWLYKVGGTAATDELVSFVEFQAPTTSTASDFTATFSAPIYITTA